MVLRLDGKTIADPLYGSVQLTKLESQIVSSAAFQRLHNVRQLGLGHLVFPSAAYSRFSHSVGACANADRILTAIESNSKRRFCAEQRQGVRLTALLHDLGHFPFSHTTEHAMKRYVREGIYQKVDVNFQQRELEMGLPSTTQEPVFIDHEDTGKLVFNGDVK